MKRQDDLRPDFHSRDSQRKENNWYNEDTPDIHQREIDGGEQSYQENNNILHRNNDNHYQGPKDLPNWQVKDINWPFSLFGQKRPTSASVIFTLAAFMVIILIIFFLSSFLMKGKFGNKSKILEENTLTMDSTEKNAKSKQKPMKEKERRKNARDVVLDSATPSPLKNNENNKINQVEKSEESRVSEKTGDEKNGGKKTPEKVDTSTKIDDFQFENYQSIGMILDNTKEIMKTHGDNRMLIMVLIIILISGMVFIHWEISRLTRDLFIMMSQFRDSITQKNKMFVKEIEGLRHELDNTKSLLKNSTKTEKMRDQEDVKGSQIPSESKTDNDRGESIEVESPVQRERELINIFNEERDVFLSKVSGSISAQVIDQGTTSVFQAQGVLPRLSYHREGKILIVKIGGKELIFPHPGLTVQKLEYFPGYKACFDIKPSDTKDELFLLSPGKAIRSGEGYEWDMKEKCRIILPASNYL